MGKKCVCLNVCKVLVLSGLFVGGSAVIGDTTPSPAHTAPTTSLSRILCK